MDFLGRFCPTRRASEKLIKGWMGCDDGWGPDETYLDPERLRQLAESCRVVADWLDEEAQNAD
jgi:hypothetical protein